MPKTAASSLARYSALRVYAVGLTTRWIAWIASDERTAWGCVAAMLIVGLVFVMEGQDKR